VIGLVHDSWGVDRQVGLNRRTDDDRFRLRNWIRIEPIFFLVVDVTVVDACEEGRLRLCLIKFVLAVFYCLFEGLEDFEVGLVSRIKLLRVYSIDKGKVLGVGGGGYGLNGELGGHWEVL